MRFLNKVIFINSATIRFAEVMLNGNVHLIGTQGVGKSTLLRAVLFFYNADTLKLGISKEKKSFAEYYFPYQNSYLVYEVMRENGPFCIIAFKSQGKTCFRFIDTAFDRKYFISGEGLAFEKWEDNRYGLDKDKIFYSNKIDRYEDYRNILYGNNEGLRKDFGRFALLQSRQYQNIPRTIQNVFLNSKLEAEFIKQTIIMSLNEEDITIDLQSYMHHLKNFEEQLADIHQYNLPSTQKIAGNVVKLHLSIRYLEKEKNQQALLLAWAAANVERLLPKLYEKKDKALADSAAIVQKAEGAATRFKNKEVKIKAELSVLDNDLKRAKEKTEHYEKLKIHELVSFVNTRKEVQETFDQFNKERQLLTSNFGEVSQKYDALLATLDSNLQKFELERNEERLQAQQHSLQEEKSLRKWLDQHLAQLRQQNFELVSQAREKVDQQKQDVYNAQLKRVTVRNSRFYEVEIAAIKQQVLDLDIYIKASHQQVTLVTAQEETMKKQWELAESGINQDIEREGEKLQENVSSLKIGLQETDDKLKNPEDSLYTWLNNHRKGWQDNIGKVIGEEVLFNTSLEPVSDDNKNNSFYGVKLALNELSRQAKTPEDYKLEKRRLESEMVRNQKLLQDLQQRQSEQLDKLKKKFQPQIKSFKDAAIEQRYKIEQDTKKLEQFLLKSKDLDIQAAEESKKALAEVDTMIAAANEALIQSERALSQAESELVKLVKAKEKDHDKKLAAIELELEKEQAAIKTGIQKYRDNYRSQKLELTARRHQELEGKGVDTSRIAFLEERLADLQLQLQQIERSRDIVAEYKKDKRELIDKVDDLKSVKAGLEHQFINEEQKYLLQRENLKAELAAADEKVDQVKVQVQQAEEDSRAFEAFSVTDAYQGIDAAYKEEHNNHRSEQRPGSLINNINTAYYTSISRLDELKETVNKFLGNFSPQNIFNFKTNLFNRDEYLAFAEQLDEFIGNSKIGEYVKRVNERFATIIHSVGRETGTLMSKGGEIQKVITSINSDFDNKNFVGAIKKIELRLDESSNKVVQLLLQIKQFNDEHSYDLGGMNLFSTIDQDSKNKKASDLLKQLGKAINEYKKEFISLSDSFELKFRIEENQNDTGWVEKLSNVGSEGTDVLVKAMINIMLLNVFKEGASKRFKDFRLHCMMDEIGKLHPNNVKGILQFANDRNINLINGSPTENNALDYKHIYKLEKDSNRYTRVKRIITNNTI